MIRVRILKMTQIMKSLFAHAAIPQVKLNRKMLIKWDQNIIWRAVWQCDYVRKLFRSMIHIFQTTIRLVKIRHDIMPNMLTLIWRHRFVAILCKSTKPCSPVSKTFHRTTSWRAVGGRSRAQNGNQCSWKCVLKVWLSGCLRPLYVKLGSASL